MILKKVPNPIDKHVGSRVRMRRMMLGMSQEKLGDALHLTFQQVQKYEKGTNRIGASRIQQISHILQVPVSFFFEGAPDAGEHGRDGRGAFAGLRGRFSVQLRRPCVDQGLHADQAAQRQAAHRRSRAGGGRRRGESGNANRPGLPCREPIRHAQRCPRLDRSSGRCKKNAET